MAVSDASLQQARLYATQAERRGPMTDVYLTYAIKNLCDYLDTLNARLDDAG